MPLPQHVWDWPGDSVLQVTCLNSQPCQTPLPASCFVFLGKHIAIYCGPYLTVSLLLAGMTVKGLNLSVKLLLQLCIGYAWQPSCTALCLNMTAPPPQA